MLGLGPGLGSAYAKDAEAPRIGADAPPVDEGAEPGAGTSRAPANDWRKGTISIAGGVSYAAPVGEVTNGLLATSVLSGGTAFQGALGLGLSRYLSLEFQGSYAALGGGTSCTGCTANSLGVGVGFIYHLAQGIAFDPWGGFGVGYRSLDINAPSGQTLTAAGHYQGFDFMRLTLGGEFYPTPSLGFGPYIEASIGSYRLRPDPASVPSAYAFLSVGFRVTFDPLRPGKAETKASSVAFAY